MSPSAFQTSASLPEALAAGVLLIADIKPRYAAVIEIIAHGGAEVRTVPNASSIVSAPTGDTFYCAYYAPDVFANPWEPCDQSIAAAYMPLRYSLLDLLPLKNGGAFLVQRRPFHERIWRNVVADDHETRIVSVDRHDVSAVVDVVEALLCEAGVPADEITRCVNAVYEQVSALG